MKKHMKTVPTAETAARTRRAKSLSEVLEQGEQVKKLVSESAEEMSAVTTTIKLQLAKGDLMPGIEHALERSAAVESKVREASGKLSAITRALEGEVRERRMVDHQLAAAMEQEEGARYMALHDVLTGLPNRALFGDRLEHGIAHAKRHGATLAVMFVDLDKFKSINDTHGHEAGDVVLQTTARRLRENTRGDDTVCRLGGDEFLFLLTEVHEEKHISMIAEKIIRAIQAPCYVSVRGLDISVSVRASIGISIFPRDGTTADTLVKIADEAMYRAKQNQSGHSFAAQELEPFMYGIAQTVK